MDDIRKLRRQAAANVGLSITGTPQSFGDLTLPQQDLVRNEMFRIIADNPDRFTETQRTLAENALNDPDFGTIRPEADESITVEKLAKAFGEEAKETAQEVGKAAAKTGGSFIGGFVGENPLLAVGLLVLVLGGAYAFLKIK